MHTCSCNLIRKLLSEIDDIEYRRPELYIHFAFNQSWLSIIAMT